MSDAPSAVTALAAVMDEVKAVAKRDKNDAQHFMFRGIDAVLNAVGPALRTHGVVVMPFVESTTYETVEIGQNRRPTGFARVTVTYRFYGPAGDFIEARVPGEAMDAGDKATPKAMSVAFRTALLQALALPTDEPDPDATSYERSEPAPPAPEAVLRGQIAAAAAEAGIPLPDVADQYRARFSEPIQQGTVENLTAYLESLGGAA